VGDSDDHDAVGLRLGVDQCVQELPQQEPPTSTARWRLRVGELLDQGKAVGDPAIEPPNPMRCRS
jgi:hypothetical protein